MYLEVPEQTSDQRNQEPTEEETDPQTPPPDSSHPLPNASAPEPTPLPAPAPAPDAERDFERVGKMAYNWALALLPISVTLLLTETYPVRHPDRVVVYAASTALACLSLIADLFLIYYSVISHPGAQLAKAQEMAMGFSAVTLALAALSRLALLIPFLLFLTIVASTILLTGVLLLPIYHLFNASN